MFGGQLVASGGECRGAAGEFVEVEQRGLVGVEQSVALEFGLVEFAFERGELGGDEVVVVGWGGRDDGSFAGDQLGWFQ